MSDKTLEKIEKTISFIGYAICTICMVIVACIGLFALVCGVWEKDAMCLLGAVAAAGIVWMLKSVREEL